MDKASKVIRRSSIRLKSIGTGHGELGLVLCGLRDMRLAAKNFAQAQTMASQDLLKWSLKAENRAIQETLIQLLELSTIWEDVQKEFNEHLREFRNNFQMIYEGERSVDHARSQLAAHEASETNLRKEIRKANKKSSAEDAQQLEVKLAQAQRSKELAQMEVVDKVQENEAVKLIRVKESLTKLSQAYLEMAAKCSIIFESHQDVVNQMPDVQDKNIHDLKYSGAPEAQHAVIRARHRINSYKSQRGPSTSASNIYPALPTTASSPNASGPMRDPPPPYSPASPSNNSSYGNYPEHMNPFETPPSASGIGFSRYGMPRTTPTSRNAGQSPFSEEEEDLAGAVGGVNLN
ncbi:uncharacterized protein LOC132204699 [Neocloeon triangulifer]|uniref:uncharacterized protein LOC132204699 n=1 Tax=Neocloeon triangulifer TaxID=2078957 RepID=UPI00286EE25E|nr:uncharacterized protein LOC132204699 [Neocloeon triangulifer]